VRARKATQWRARALSGVRGAARVPATAVAGRRAFSAVARPALCGFPAAPLVPQLAPSWEAYLQHLSQSQRAGSSTSAMPTLARASSADAKLHRDRLAQWESVGLLA
jgi:hypothetical protein